MELESKGGHIHIKEGNSDAKSTVTMAISM